MWRVIRGTILTTVLAVQATGTIAFAQDDPCIEPTPELLLRPDPDGTPTPVSMGVYLIDLYSIEDVHQTFQADLILSARWKDLRLAAGMDPASAHVCTFPDDLVWNPQPMLLNGRGVEEGLPAVVQVRADGTCTWGRRYSGTFSFKTDLRDFPFDEQVLAVGVVVPPRVGQVLLAADEELSGLWDEVSIPNWRRGESRTRIYERYLPQVRRAVPVFEIALDVERFDAYYVWKLIVPLVIVVLMSWAVFYISPKAGLQLGLGATSVLTLIAYRFATATLLPPIGYLTRLDLFLTGSSVLVLGALIEALVTVGLGDRDRAATALKVDRVCRLAFPLAFLGVIVWSFWL